LEKLREKKQSEKQRKQANLAVTLYFESVSQSVEKVINNQPQEQKFTRSQSPHTKNGINFQYNRQLRDVETHTHEPVTATKDSLEFSGADWTGVYNDLNNAKKSAIIPPQP